jgi:hypothetical protein
MQETNAIVEHDLSKRIPMSNELRSTFRRSFTRINHASVAIAKDGNQLEVSKAESDAEHDDNNSKPSAVNPCDEGIQVNSTYQCQMQQLFMTLQNERHLHQEELNH